MEVIEFVKELGNNEDLRVPLELRISETPGDIDNSVLQFVLKSLINWFREQ